MITITTSGYMPDGHSTPWFELIREANRLEHVFRAPDFLGTRPGADFYVEEYPDADVQIRTDESVPGQQRITILTKTEKGERLLRAVAAKFPVTVTES